MPFDGSGNFNRTMNWVSDALAGIKIRSDRHDQEDDNFASGLSNTLTKDGQSQPTADIPMNGKKLVNLSAPVNPTDAATMSFAQNIGAHIHSANAKAVPVDADEFVLADSVSTPTAWTRAKTTFAQFKAAVFAAFGGLVHAAAAKATLVDLDEFTIGDSVSTPDPWALKRHTWANLKTMIGITDGQRLGVRQDVYPADANTLTATGWYGTANTTTNTPAAQFGIMQVQALTPNDLVQVWQATTTPGAVYRRTRLAGTWSAWVEVTSANALRKDTNGTIDGGGYQQVLAVDDTALASTGSYQITVAGGNFRTANPPATTPLTVLAPAGTTNCLSMVVRLQYPSVVGGAVTLSGFNKISGDAITTTLGSVILLYITQLNTHKSVFVEKVA